LWGPLNLARFTGSRDRLAEICLFKNSPIFRLARYKIVRLWADIGWLFFLGGLKNCSIMGSTNRIFWGLKNSSITGRNRLAAFFRVEKSLDYRLQPFHNGRTPLFILSVPGVI